MVNFLSQLFIRVLGACVGMSIGHFLGSDRIPFFVVSISLFGFIFLFRRYSVKLQDSVKLQENYGKKYGNGLLVFLHIWILVLIGILGSLIRTYICSHIGVDFPLFPVVFAMAAGQGLPEHSSPDPDFCSGSWIDKSKWEGQPGQDLTSSQPKGSSNPGPSAQEAGSPTSIHSVNQDDIWDKLDS